MSLARASSSPRTQSTMGGPARQVPRWVRELVVWMDEAIAVPGTRFRIGADSILGLIFPGIGDAVTAGSHLALLWAAFQMRVPRIVFARMLLNVAIDAVVGAVPMAGDVFDAFFKANRRNLALLERNRGGGPARATAVDYAIVFGAMLIAVGLLLLPIAIAAWIASLLFA